MSSEKQQDFVERAALDEWVSLAARALPDAVSGLEDLRYRTMARIDDDQTDRPMGRDESMLYELRHYDIYPDQWEPYLAWLGERANPVLFDQFQLRLIGFWRGVPKQGEGEPSPNLYWLLAWESEAEMRERWAAIFASPEWQAAWAEVINPATGRSKYHRQTSSTLMQALPFSPIQ